LVKKPVKTIIMPYELKVKEKTGKALPFKPFYGNSRLATG